MKTAVRIAASVAIVAAAAAAVARLCWQPWPCNREEARIAARIAKMLEFPGALSVRISARQDLEAIERTIHAKRGVRIPRMRRIGLAVAAHPVHAGRQQPLPKLR